MRKFLLTITTVLTITAASAQTFVGSVNSLLSAVQLAANEYAFYEVINDSLIIYNDDLSLHSSFFIPTKANSEGAGVSFISKHLFDQDSGIEFLINYRDTATNKINDIKIIDNGIGTSLPNMTYSNITGVHIDVRNTNNGSQLIVQQHDFVSNPYNPSTKTTVFNLSGQVLKVKEYELIEQNLYPNPSNEIVNVPASPGETINLFDVNGNLLKQVQSNSHGHVLKVNNLPSGSYIIQGSNGGSWKFQKP